MRSCQLLLHIQGGGTQLFAVLRSSSLVKVHGQKKSALTFDFCFVQSLVNFWKITFTQLSKIDAWLLTYQKSYLDFWLSPWPRTKIKVQDILECHPLDITLACVGKTGRWRDWECKIAWENQEITCFWVSVNQPSNYLMALEVSSIAAFKVATILRLRCSDCNCNIYTGSPLS